MSDYQQKLYGNLWNDLAKVQRATCEEIQKPGQPHRLPRICRRIERVFWQGYCRDEDGGGGEWFRGLKTEWIDGLSDWFIDRLVY